MLLTRDNLPGTIFDIAALDELLCRPSQALIDDLRKVDGDIMILGVAGKMGPTLAGLAKAALPDRKIIGVARFSDASVKKWLRARSIETINCDLLDEAAINALPKVPNIVFMAGRKFGAEDDLSLTWAMNAHVPALVAQAFRDSRIVAFSTGCVYPFVPVDGKGADEATAPNPPGGHALWRAARHRGQGAAGQADRRQPRPYQFHLAGRRLGASLAMPGALRHADLADQCQWPRNPRRTRSRGHVRQAAWARTGHRR